MLRQFRLPDLGEGLTEGEILQWLVAVGDEVVLNQPIVEVETAKAAVEVPSPFAGTVTALHADAGTSVEVGVPIISFDVGGDGEPPARTPVLVGYGARPADVRRRPRRPAPPEPPIAAVPPGRPAPHPAALAKPPVRKLARDSGIDLAAVVGTGPAGTVTREDVRAAGERLAAPAPATGGGQRIAVKGVRREMAVAMVASAAVPQATVFTTVDVTPTMDLIGRLTALPEFAEVKVTPLLLVARALLVAIARHPMINSRWDEPAQEIVVSERVHLGIAAATPRGLVVPNVKDAHLLSLADLAAAVQALTATARAGRTAPADLAGGTVTITNVGVFGVDTGTPLLNPGEVAILALGAVADRPWVHDGALAVRKVTTLALAFDHRVVDGQLGAQVLADVAALLADPARFVAWT